MGKRQRKYLSTDYKVQVVNSVYLGELRFYHIHHMYTQESPIRTRLDEIQARSQRTRNERADKEVKNTHRLRYAIVRT